MANRLSLVTMSEKLLIRCQVPILYAMENVAGEGRLLRVAVVTALAAHTAARTDRPFADLRLKIARAKPPDALRTLPQELPTP